MAITGRAARTTDLGASSTPDVVGPGSYLKTDRDLPVHAYAPFQSTAERLGSKAAEDPKKVMPGPGQYEVPRKGHVINGKRAAGSAFVSKTARLGRTDATMAPGPGQYTTRDEWTVRPRQETKSPLQGVAYLKVPTAPSIPAPEQSYGYEETHAGELVLQKPPPGGYSGVSGRLSAGPGSYEPNRAAVLTKPHTTGVAWGNSRVQRQVFSNSNDTPGPGAYSAGSSEAADPATAARAARPSAAFSSRVPLAHQLASDPERIQPGPGAYSAGHSFAPKAMPENLQTFGSTQKRLASDAVTTNERQRMAQPGPGAYEEGRTAFSRKKHAAAELSSFNTSEQRFKPLAKVAQPGPGAYDLLDQHTFVVNLQRKTHGRNGVFGSTTRRFHTLKQDPVPGAGSYNPVRAGATNQGDEPTSSFASGQERFAKTAPATLSGKAPKDPVPPPWQYEVRSQNGWDKRASASRKADAMFGTSVQRFGEGGGRSRVNVPGPGSYAPKYPNEGFRKQQTQAECFGSKQARFGGLSGFSANTPNPGPGDYESGADTVDPLVKRSFNITIAS